MWKQFIDLEQVACEEIPDRSALQKKAGDKLKDIGPCRYFRDLSRTQFCIRPVGIPENVLHIVLDYPRNVLCTVNDVAVAQSGSYDSARQLSLEKSLRGKGFTSETCFLFYCFPQACNFTPTNAYPSPRERWPNLRTVHDKLHAYWRSRGGKIVLIFGDNAMKAYNDMVRRDNVLKERLFAAEAYEVYVERSRVYRFHVFLVDAGGV